MPSPKSKPDSRLCNYVYGDQSEIDVSQYYCAQCDLFVEADHFLAEHGERIYERALLSIAGWSRRAAESKYQCPATVVNILLDEARRRQVAYEAARSPF